MFHSLFQAGKIGKLELKNRLIMAAMGNALAGSEGAVNEAMLDYYRPRGRGGVGLVITQFAAVSPEAVMPYNLRLDDDRWSFTLQVYLGEIEFEGVRVTPNVYTTLEEVDTFTGAMEEIAVKGTD